MTKTLDTKIFPSAKRGYNGGATYRLLYVALKNKISPYAVLGEEADSVDRERAFTELSEILHVKYDVIYDLWLQTKYY